MATLPIVVDIGMQNILAICETKKSEWSELELEETILGLNKIHELTKGRKQDE